MLHIEAEIMLSKSLCVALVILAIGAFEVSSASASGRGASGSHPGGRPGVAGCRTGSGGCWGNSGRYLRAENGIFGSTWACGNAGWGWGGAGYGWGYGLGYAYPGWEYQLEGVPYFAQFPPIYYGYGENTPVLKAPIRSTWAGGESPRPAESAVSASPARPPLRIVNPYYAEAKAD